MSKIGKQPIQIPDAVNVMVKDSIVTVKGPKGELTVNLPRPISLEILKSQAVLKRKNDDPKNRALHGLTRALIANAVAGVTGGFNKGLELKGIGFRAEIQNDKLVLNVGFSHPVEIAIPQDLTLKQEKNQIQISGIDKQKVGQFAATIRAIRPPEPYKGKGIRYVDEIIKLKPGKQVTKAAV